MILPTKRLASDRALISVGAELLLLLEQPRSTTQLWSAFQMSRETKAVTGPVSYDWFVLALDLLFMLGAVEWSARQLRRRSAT